MSPLKFFLVLLLGHGARTFACSDPINNKIRPDVGFADSSEVYVGTYQAGKFKILHTYKGKPTGVIEKKCIEDYREGLTYVIYVDGGGTKGVYLGQAIYNLAIHNNRESKAKSGDAIKAVKISNFLSQKQTACNSADLPDCGKCTFADAEPSKFCDECKAAMFKFDACLTSTHACLDIEDDTRAEKCDAVVRKATAKILKLKWLN